MARALVYVCVLFVCLLRNYKDFLEFLYIILHSQNQCMRDSISPFLPELGTAIVFYLFIFYGEISVKLLGPFFNWIVFLSLISRFLCTFWVMVLYQMSFANTLFQPVDCLLILLTFPFQSKNFNFNEAQFANYFIDWVFLVQFSSLAQSCPTLCDPMNRRMPGLPVHHQLPEFIQTHVHQVGDAI